MQEALGMLQGCKKLWGMQGKEEAGPAGPSRQEQGMGQGSLLSPGCLLTASGNQWLRKFLDFGIPASKQTRSWSGPPHITLLI